MINETKIKYMTKAAIFDSKEEKGDLYVNHYFKGDYVTYHVIRVFVGITVGFVLLLAMWALLGMDTLLETASIETLIPLAIRAVACYLVLAVAYVGIAIVVYRTRYEASRKHLKEYTGLLKRLNQYYQSEEKIKETTAEANNP